MLRIASILAVAVGAFASAAPPKAISIVPKTVTIPRSKVSLSDLTAEIEKQTGMAVAVPKDAAAATIEAGWDKQPLWTVLEDAAKQAKLHIGIAGESLSFSPSSSATAPSFIDGAFRIVAKRIQSRLDFEAGQRECEVTLEVQWEPRIPVFLIDAIPAIEIASEGKVEAIAGKSMPLGCRVEATIKLKGIPRTAAKIAKLDGSFAVVASPGWLDIEFDEPGAKETVSKTIDGIAATWKPAKKTEKRTVFRIDLDYPTDHPEFESFQQWATRNTLTLISPDRTKQFVCDPEDASSSSDGRRVLGEYNVPTTGRRSVDFGNLEGWKAVYRTPQKMISQTIRFQFRDLELP